MLFGVVKFQDVMTTNPSAELQQQNHPAVKLEQIQTEPAVEFDHFYQGDGLYQVGHPVEDLEKIHQTIMHKKSPKAGTIWLVGDSTLDNKWYVSECYEMYSDAREHFKDQCTKMPSPYGDVISGVYPDVAYWINKVQQARNTGVFAINTAVEASRLLKWTSYTEGRAPAGCFEPMEPQVSITTI